MSDDTTMRALQDRARYGVHTYSAEFERDPRGHKHMAHALQHILKHAGQLAAILDDMDHGLDGGGPFRKEAEKRLADVVICAMRFANEWVSVDDRGSIDLAAAVAKRMDGKGMGAGGGPQKAGG